MLGGHNGPRPPTLLEYGGGRAKNTAAAARARQAAVVRARRTYLRAQSPIQDLAGRIGERTAIANAVAEAAKSERAANVARLS